LVEPVRRGRRLGEDVSAEEGSICARSVETSSAAPGAPHAVVACRVVGLAIVTGAVEVGAVTYFLDIAVSGRRATDARRGSRAAAVRGAAGLTVACLEVRLDDRVAAAANSLTVRRATVAVVGLVTVVAVLTGVFVAVSADESSIDPRIHARIGPGVDSRIHARIETGVDRSVGCACIDAGIDPSIHGRLVVATRREGEYCAGDKQDAESSIHTDPIPKFDD
jgi:hypothetical protein